MLRHAARLLLTSSAPTRYTTLGNGVTVATEHCAHAPHSSVGVYFAAGLRAETPYNNGVAALTARVLGHGVADGVLLTPHATKEVTGVVAHFANGRAPSGARVLGERLSRAAEVLGTADFARFKAAQAAAAAALEADPAAMVHEHLNAQAFQGFLLALPTLGTPELLADVEVSDAVRLVERHLVGLNVVVAGAGQVDHDELVAAVEQLLRVAPGARPPVAQAAFLGLEIRMRDDTNPKAYVSIAVKGEGRALPAHHVAQVGAAVFGAFDSLLARARYTLPKLALIVQDYHLVDKYRHFLVLYADTGLWGFAAEIGNTHLIDDFVHFTLKEWNRLLVSVTDAEVARARAQTKRALLAALATPELVAADIATSVLTLGYRVSVEEALLRIDEVSTAKVKQWANVALWDQDIVIAGTGSIEALLDYNRSRNDMAMMRW